MSDGSMKFDGNPKKGIKFTKLGGASGATIFVSGISSKIRETAAGDPELHSVYWENNNKKSYYLKVRFTTSEQTAYLIED